jgi:hypothetical protein
MGRRAGRRVRTVQVAVAPLDADFVHRIRIASLGLTVFQSRGCILNDRTRHRFNRRRHRAPIASGFPRSGELVR